MKILSFFSKLFVFGLHSNCDTASKFRMTEGGQTSSPSRVSPAARLAKAQSRQGGSAKSAFGATRLGEDEGGLVRPGRRLDSASGMTKGRMDFEKQKKLMGYVSPEDLFFGELNDYQVRITYAIAVPAEVSLLYKQ